jgi:phosphoribosyl 1,2-cyclic phosphodiesterase
MEKNNQVFWTMKDGTQIDIDNMSINHLRNTLKMIIRNVKAKKRLTHLHGEIAQQMYDQMIEEEFSSDSDFEIFIGEL